MIIALWILGAVAYWVVGVFIYAMIDRMSNDGKPYSAKGLAILGLIWPLVLGACLLSYPFVYFLNWILNWIRRKAKP